MFKQVITVAILLCRVVFAQQEIAGFWMTMDHEKNKPSSVVAVYPYEGKFYARIIGSFNDKGEIDDSIYKPDGRAPGLEGHPYYSGLDFVWNATYEGAGKFSGYVVDPRNGKVYDAELWRSGPNLILRGELFMFGQNEVWPPFPENKFNDTFKKPDVSTFVPIIPQPLE
jgi:uncharacterized protein (DUF2147 family)